MKPLIYRKIAGSILGTVAGRVKGRLLHGIKLAVHEAGNPLLTAPSRQGTPNAAHGC
jgi:hypothetical protein